MTSGDLDLHRHAVPVHRKHHPVGLPIRQVRACKQIVCISDIISQSARMAKHGKETFSFVYIPADVNDPIQEWRQDYSQEDEVECLVNRVKVRTFVASAHLLCPAITRD
jgi:hypothetical protein